MIEIKGLTKVFDKTVLDNMSYTFEDNKIYVIKGVSGCGKTTLLNILGGLDELYEGQYLFRGEDVHQFGGAQKRSFKDSVGYIFQSSLLMSKLTVMENLTYINNDRQLIIEYARQLKVEKLLDKTPEQLSGGERQRISVIRTLIQQPSVILADEPTASLDKLNSKEIADIFASLRSKNRTIIIATHESCFDDVADEIIHLEYGVVDSVETKEPQQKESHIELQSGSKKGNSFKVLLPLIFRRHREKFKITALLPMIFIITAILLCFAVQHNFKSEVMRSYVGQYPSEVILLMDDSVLEQIEEKYGDVQEYYPYRIITEEYLCCPLLPEENSVLAYGNLLKYGTFPKEQMEVLVGYWTAVGMVGKENIEDCIGRTLDIDGHKYTITGVVADVDNDPSVDAELYYMDASYNNTEGISVYIPYETISQYGERTIYSLTMAKIDGLYEDTARYNDIKHNMNMGQLSQIDHRISEMQYSLDSVTKVVLAAFVVVAFMAALFIKNDIEVDLFYRRKELGYLQVFGVKKKTIWLQLILEKMAKNTISMVAAVVVYYVIAIIVKIALDINGFIPVSYILGVLGIELGFTFISVLIPIWKYMRKSVLKLITE